MLRILTLILFSTWVLGQDELLTTSFEGENLDWITLSYQGDDPGARDWRTQTDSFERGHTGIRFMEIDGNYDENFCAPIKSKILLSPPIQTGYSAELELRFWQKFYAAQNVTHDKKIVVFDVSVGIPVVVDTITRAEIKLAAGASSSSPWLERVITIPGMANKTIQIGWWYVAETGGSTSTVCADTWKIDDVRLVGNQSQGPGETIITSPATDKVIRVGDSLTFEGHIEGGEPGSTLIWEFCADNSSNCLYSGRPVGSRQFTQPGVYEVVAYSRSPSGEEDLTPARRTIRVVAGNIRPTVQITSPRRRSLTVRVGDPIPFSGQATDADGSVQNYFWLLKPGDQTISGQASVEYAFQKTGHYGVICAASDNDGGIGYDFRLIEVIAKDGNIPPDISIQSPQDGQVFQVNETFSIIGKLTDYDGTGGRIQWDFGDGRTSPSLTIQNFKYSRPGRYTIQLTARDGNRVVKDQVTIYVVNRERVPAPEIVQPTTDLLIQPGQSVFLEGVVPGSTASHKNLKWTFGDGRSTRQTTPGR
ncbi:MAG: PKD domain-containing protein, partial [Acidobacteria bacterium]|nr:PKD domain-containing protein [Acidobacteriota bacterium]